MPKPVAVKPLPDFRIWIRYDDGVEGIVDLSDLAAGGVFAAWNDRQFLRPSDSARTVPSNGAPKLIYARTRST